jgi:hypothetical protein
VAKNTLEIVVKAKDQASAVLNGVGKSAMSLGSVGKLALGGIAIAGAAATAAVVGIGAAITKLAVDAAPLQGIQAAFEGITGGGERMLEQLRVQSAHMIADRDLMKSYNLAAQLVGKTFADRLPDAMKYLTKVSAATGQSMDFMMDSLVRGVGRLSPLILDNLGIQVSLEEATAEASRMFGKEAEALSKVEIQAGMTNVVMAKLAKNTEAMPDVIGSAAQGLAAMNTMWVNFKDEIGLRALPALQSILQVFQELRPFIMEAAGWIADLVSQWASGFMSLVRDAAYWGANIMESLASGIQGSGAIVRALRSVGDTITRWLQPGSPPLLLPDLPEWGAGALDAWLSGWTLDAVAGSQLLQGLRANLRPFLEKIDLGEGLDEGALRDVFKADAPAMRRYLQSYERVGKAVSGLKDARDALAEAEEGGDEAAIKAARENLAAAEQEEYSARRAFNAEERRLEQRISAEAQIAKAVTETARVQAAAAADSARLAEEAKQRAIAQAHLQYRLAVAGTAAGQIPIWEEELAKAEEGSAEYWQIMTRLVELRRAAAKEAEGAGEAVGAGFADGLTAGAAALSKPGGGLDEKIDWAGIGSAIGGAIVNGIVDGFTSLSSRLKEWTDSGEGSTALFEAGGFIAELVLSGLRGIFGLPAATEGTTDSITTHLQAAAFNTGSALVDIGGKLAEGLLAAFAAKLTAGGTKEEVMAAWEASVLDWRTPMSGIFAKVFDSSADAALVANSLLAVANDEGVAAGVREAARIQAQKYIDEYGLVLHGEMGVLTAEAYRQLAIDEGIISEATIAGACAGTAMGEAASRALEESFDAVLPVPDFHIFTPEDFAPQTPGGRGIPGYADGGVVWQPTLAWLGERGPEVVTPLGEKGTVGDTYNITIPIDARGADAAQVKYGVLAGLRAAGIPIGN